MSYIELISPSGNVTRTLRATMIDPGDNALSQETTGAHLVLVLDQSGSMCRDMAVMKTTLLKLLALEEYKNAALLVSLLSYSSCGEVYTHIRRAPIADILGPSGVGRQAIERLHATNLTCISGGLAAALSVIRDDESTMLVLHSDGYANDPSPYSEAREIGKVLDTFASKANVMISTVCYGAADFALLDMVAARGGGVCVRATSAGQVFDALHSVTKPAVGTSKSVRRFEAKGKLLVGYSKSARKVMSGRDELSVKGLQPSDDLAVWEVEPYPFDLQVTHSEPQPTLLFARAMLSMGKYNEAKQAVLGLRATTLYPHLRALTSPQIAEFAQALDAAIFGELELTFTSVAGVTSSGPTILDVIEVLRQHEGQYLVNYLMLTTGRTRRSIARENGTRVDGKIVPPAFTTKAKDSSPWLRVNSIEMSRTAATINMNVTRDVDLVDAQGTVVREVAGVPLELKDYRNITIVGEGNPTIETLHVKPTDKRLTKRLESMGFTLVEGVAAIPFGTMSVLNPGEVGQELVDDEHLFNKLTLCNIARRMLDACLEGKSVAYTPKQVKAFAEHCLSKSLNYNPPTVNPYDDRQAAIQRGDLDSYTTYRIELGSTRLFSLSDLPSANDFLQRRFVCTEARGATDGGKPMDKPTMADVLGGCSVQVKSAKDIKRLKMGVADDLMFPLFVALFGMTAEEGFSAGNAQWADLLSAAGVDREDADRFLNGALFEEPKDARVELAAQVRDTIAHYEELLVSQTLAPTVLYAGATGFLPEVVANAVTAMSADELEQAHKVKVPGAKRESVFYVFADGRILSVRPETVWYTVSK